MLPPHPLDDDIFVLHNGRKGSSIFHRNSPISQSSWNTITPMLRNNNCWSSSRTICCIEEQDQACWFVGMRLLTTISHLGGLTAESYRYVLFVKLFPVCLFKALISVKSSCSPLRHILLYIVRTQTNIPIYWLCCLYAVVYSIYSFCYFVCLLSLVCSASTASSEFHNLILKNLIFALKFSYVYQCLFRKWKPKFT